MNNAENTKIVGTSVEKLRAVLTALDIDATFNELQKIAFKPTYSDATYNEYELKLGITTPVEKLLFSEIALCIKLYNDYQIARVSMAYTHNNGGSNGIDLGRLEFVEQGDKLVAERKNF